MNNEFNLIIYTQYQKMFLTTNQKSGHIPDTHYFQQR